MSMTYRTPMSLPRRLLAGCLTAAMGVSGWSVAAASADRLVVFGTSLSDPGNSFALNGGTNTPPDYSVDALLIPDRPYGHGGHHFSNGATWIEQLAGSVGLAASVQPAFQSNSSVATNFAVGAARARDDGKNVNLPMQVDAFLQHVQGDAPANALYVIEMGGNDIRDALAAAASGGDPSAVIQQALTSIAGNVGSLYQAGARRFLVWNAPNVGLTPAIRQLDAQFPGIAPLATFLTIVFNAGLNAVVEQLSALPGIEIRRFDAFQKLNDMTSNPAAFGLANVTSACIALEAPYVCDEPDRHLFWDGIHPTRAVHAILALEAAAVLSQ